MEQQVPPTGPRRKRKKTEKDCKRSVTEEPCKVPKTEGPSGKKRVAVRPKRRNRKQENAFRLDTFISRYIIGEKLGEGGFGSVFKGTRVSDGLQVAIKFVPKKEGQVYVQSPAEPKAVPVEVALMQAMNQPPICSSVVRLYEWFDEDDRYILILERPDSCVDLESFLDNFGSMVDEETARAIMRRVVEAARHCQARGVLHRDIKLENLLINTDTSEIKLIDFGCGDWLLESEYETFKEGWYRATPATVWSLGVLLFRMVCGSFPYMNEEDIIDGFLRLKDGLSDGKINGSVLLKKNPWLNNAELEVLPPFQFQHLLALIQQAYLAHRYGDTGSSAAVLQPCNEIPLIRPQK